MYTKRFIIFFLCLLVFGTWAQPLDSARYFNRIKQSEKYSTVGSYAEAAQALKVAISVADSLGWEELYIDAQISLAELMRKTRDFDLGKQVLYKLTDSYLYPKLHVRKLGRMAALHNETIKSATYSEAMRKDSVLYYLNTALDLAQRYDFRDEEMSLTNELGFFISVNSSRLAGTSLLSKAANYYENKRDTLSYINSLTRILENYAELNNASKVDSISSILISIISKKNWPYKKVEVYDALAIYAGNNADSLGYYKWKYKSERSREDIIDKIYNDKMASLRVSANIEKFQDQAERSSSLVMEKDAQLIAEANRRRVLVIIALVLGVLMLGVGVLLYREINLRATLKKLNQKNEMLMVENNHRVKNNLQMIISMLEYSSSKVSDKRVIRKIQDKIHIISTLHKHLSSEAHNPNVRLDHYLEDIIRLYTNLMEYDIEIDYKLLELGIPSERIVYFGLILNEMLTNTIEHNKQKTKKVKVSVIQNKQHFIFEYSDNSEIEGPVSEGLGKKLIKQLITRVGGKKYNFDTDLCKYYFEFSA